MINQSELENEVENQILEEHFATCQFLNWNFLNASDFESWFLQRVNFWNKKYNALDFELNIFRRQFTKKSLHSQNYLLIHFNPWKRHIFGFFVLFLKSMILK